MKKRIFLTLLLLLVSPLIAFSQNESFLDTLLKCRESIVTVNVLVGQAIQPQQDAAIDPRTGRILVARSLKTAQMAKNGAGVIINPNGLIVTNMHVVQAGKKIAVQMHNGTTVPAKILEIYAGQDLALLKIDPPFPLKAIELADSNQVQLGDDVINIGNSVLLKETISGGRIAGLGTTPLDNGGQNVEMIKVNMNFYKGDSGGPILNKDGQLIGIIVAKRTGVDKVSFAIPSNKIKKLYLKFIN